VSTWKGTRALFDTHGGAGAGEKKEEGSAGSKSMKQGKTGEVRPLLTDRPENAGGVKDVRGPENVCESVF